MQRERVASAEREKEKLDRSLGTLSGLAEKSQALAKGWTPGPDGEPRAYSRLSEPLSDFDPARSQTRSLTG